MLTNSFTSIILPNPNCNFNYCQAKDEIPFLQYEKEPCLLSKENVKHFLPREIFCSFDQEEVGVELNLPEYCAVFLFVLYLEQHRHFPKQIIALASEDPLENSDIVASVSPFYHGKTKLLHVEVRIAAYASRNRSQEFMEKYNAYYKLILPHKALITQAIVFNAHQRNMCCCASFVRVILNEQFHLPRAQMTIKNTIKKCAFCLLARCSKNKIEPPTGNIQNFRIPTKVDDEKIARTEQYITTLRVPSE